MKFFLTGIIFFTSFIGMVEASNLKKTTDLGEGIVYFSCIKEKAYINIFRAGITYSKFKIKDKSKIPEICNYFNLAKK